MSGPSLNGATPPASKSKPSPSKKERGSASRRDDVIAELLERAKTHAQILAGIYGELGNAIAERNVREIQARVVRKVDRLKKAEEEAVEHKAYRKAMDSKIRRDGKKAEDRRERILHLREVEEWTYPAIAKELGISTSRVRELYFRQKRVIRMRMRPKWLEAASTAPIGTKGPVCPVLAWHKGEWIRVEEGWQFVKPNGELWGPPRDKPGEDWSGELIYPEGHTP